MKKKIDPGEVKWFGPLWRRLALAAVLAAWCVAEWLGGDQFWFLLTLAVFAYLIWRLFIAFPSPAEILEFEAEQKRDTEQKIARQKAEMEEAEPGQSDAP